MILDRGTQLEVWLSCHRRHGLPSAASTYHPPCEQLLSRAGDGYCVVRRWLRAALHRTACFERGRVSSDVVDYGVCTGVPGKYFAPRVAPSRTLSLLNSLASRFDGKEICRGSFALRSIITKRLQPKKQRKDTWLIPKKQESNKRKHTRRQTTFIFNMSCFGPVVVLMPVVVGICGGGSITGGSGWWAVSC